MLLRELKSQTIEYARWEDEIRRENRRAIRLLWYTLVPLGVVNMIAQSVIASPAVSAPRSAMLLVYAILLAAVDSFVLPKEPKHTTALLYLLSTPVFLLGTLLGTAWDPERQASTILLLMVVLPMFVMDRLRRVASVMALWLAAFLALSCAYKTDELFRVDALHGIEFYFASLVIYTLTTQVRLKYLRNLETVAYERDHDRQTGCLSRGALNERLGGSVGRQLVLMVVGLEQLQLYRDYFGLAAADAMLVRAVEALSDAYGENAVFRVSESEFACLCEEENAQTCLGKLDGCRAVLRDFRWEERTISVGCAAGYVTGAPASGKDARKMLRLANIYAHKARRMGRDQTVGGAFDEQALASGIHQSALLAEINGLDNNRLTGLPDLSYFISHTDVLLTNVADRTHEPMVGFIKLQHLRDYNSRFGYAKGDELLVETVELLRRAFPDRFLCHITGGQFCVLCYGAEAETGIAKLREEQKRAAFGAEMECKAGFAAYTGTQSAISLLDRAMSAYESIRTSKESDFRYYDAKLDEELRFKEYIATHVDEAIESGWLKVFYQPIIRATTGMVCNEEALCRWDDPNYGLLPPGRFISVLEERGLIYKADLFVVRQVLREFETRRELGVPVVPVSVNLSRRDFEERDMVKEIDALVEAAGCDKSLIKIEITESAFVTNQELLKNELRRFHTRGFDIWMDDFGSEYSTLNLMQELDFDLIKIDMKFMENFTPDGRNYVIVSKIIDMARELGISTLIEGVETKDQLRMMQILGCEKIQGFLYNSPHPLDYIAERVKAGDGLQFEDAASVDYYETVGRVNLNEPMANAEGKSHLLTADVMPAGVIEMRGSSAFCLRGTDAFLRQMERWGLLSAEEDHTRIRELATLPDRWKEAAGRCMETEDWVSYTTKTVTGLSLVVYVRRLGDVSWNGGTALLVVLLPEVKL